MLDNDLLQSMLMEFIAMENSASDDFMYTKSGNQDIPCLLVALFVEFVGIQCACAADSSCDSMREAAAASTSFNDF